MFATIFTLLALAPMACAAIAVVGTLAWYYIAIAPKFAAFEAAVATIANAPAVKPAVIRVAPLRAFEIDGVRVLATSYTDALRIAA